MKGAAALECYLSMLLVILLTWCADFKHGDSGPSIEKCPVAARDPDLITSKDPSHKENRAENPMKVSLNFSIQP